MNRLKKKNIKEDSWKRWIGSFFGLTLISLLLIWLWRGINHSQWKGQFWFGLVEQEETVVVKLFNLKDKKLVQFLLPAETMVPVGFGFGEYRLGKIAQLGQLEKKPGLILSRAVQDLMGVSIIGWQVNNQTNLTWWDKIRLIWFEKFEAKVKEKINLGESMAWKLEQLSDQSPVFRVNQTILDQLVHEQIFDQQLAEEGLSLAVLNATGVDGIASSIGRLASNLGIEVRLVSNAPEQAVSQIKVINDQLKTTLTVKNLSEVLKIKNVEVTDIFEYRSDVIIIIGQDYTNL